MTPLTPDQLTALRSAAEKATQGEWMSVPSHGGNYRVLEKECVDGTFGNIALDVSKQDGKFIALANPETIKALLNERKADKERLSALDVNMLSIRLGEAITEYWNVNKFDFDQDRMVLVKLSEIVKKITPVLQSALTPQPNQAGGEK